MANPLEDVFGSTPSVAPYIPTIFGDEQIKALEDNIAAFPDISKLGTQYYDYMMGMMNQAIPGFSNILSQGGALTSQMEGQASQELAGQIPQHVQEQVQRSSAFQNLLSGGGGGMASANTARNYGLTSLDLINQGANLATTAGNAAQRWAGLASGMIMNPSGMMVTPQQQAALTMQNNLYKQQTQQLQNNLNAAPNPVAAGISGTIMNLLGAYLGHGMGGGGGSITPSYSSMGQSAPYIGGNVSTPSGAAYGQGTAQFDPATPGLTPTSFNDQVPLPSGGAQSSAYPYGIAPNPFTDYQGLDLSSMVAYQSNFPGGG